MTTSEKIREIAGRLEPTKSAELGLLADEVAELEKRAVPEGWMPYRLVHRSEDEVWVEPSGWWVQYRGLFDSRKRLMDPTPDWQSAIAAAAAAKEKTA